MLRIQLKTLERIEAKARDNNLRHMIIERRFPAGREGQIGKGEYKFPMARCKFGITILRTTRGTPSGPYAFSVLKPRFNTSSLV